jgi:hypothetical protein
VDQAAFARRRTGQVVGAAAADVVFVFGDVGQLQEVAEGADDRLGDIAAAGRAGGQFGPGGGVAVAGEADGCLANALDNVENRFAFLFADRVAKHAAKQADVGAEGSSLLLSSACADIGVS